MQFFKFLILFISLIFLLLLNTVDKAGYL